MSSPRLKFGINMPNYGMFPFDFYHKVIMEAEAFGFDSFWTCDHLFMPKNYYKWIGSENIEKRDALEAWTLLTALAAKTERIKVGTAVTNITLRHPSILAKIIATLDVISQGRVIFGVGAGWNKEENVAYGIPWYPHKVRIAMLEEAIKFMKILWTEPNANFSGHYFRVENVPFWPKPISKPHPPIWIGGSSSGILEIIKESGNGWFTKGTPETLREKLAELEKVFKNSQRKVTDIEIVLTKSTHIDRSRDEALRKAEKYMKNLGQNLDRAIKEGLFGAPNSIIERIEEYVNAGMTYLVLRPIPVKDAFKCIELYGKEVLPHFKDNGK